MKKKAFKWLFIFPPYGIYLLYKYKILNPIITTIITIIGLLIIVITIDTVVNPYRTYNSVADKAIKEFNIKNENKMGNIRFVEREDNIKIENINYLKYSIYTNEGKYYAYLKPNGKQLNVSGIYQIEPERKPIYGEDILPKYISKVFPEITVFMDGNSDKYGKYKRLKKTVDKETQIIETTKGIYKFEVEFDQVVKIYKIGANGEGELLYSKEPQLKLNSKIAKGLKKYKDAGNVEKVLSCEFYTDKIVQVIKTTNGIYKLDLYDDGRIKIFKGK